jgi:5-methylcytosine-specific restriction endonuclease McrA
MKAWKSENKEKFRGYTKTWREKHPDLAKERSDRSNLRQRLLHGDKINARKRDTYPQRREAQIAYLREWQKTDRGIAIGAAHRAKRLDRLRGTFTPEEWKSLLVATDRKCLLCGLPQKECIYAFRESGPRIGRLTVDHIVPLSRGGLNVIGNLQPLCMVCQKKKFTRSTDYRSPEVRAMFPMPPEEEIKKLCEKQQPSSSLQP